MASDHTPLRPSHVAWSLGALAPVSRRRRCGSRSASTRLEHAPVGEPGRYHRIGHDAAAIEALFVDLFLDAHRKAPPRQIVLDLDATDVPLHGHQEGRFFHGYYDAYCYLPLYVFCGRHLLAARLRRADIDASAGAVDEVARIVRRLRARWPRVRILLRADSGFAREALMAWCEANRVDFLFGLARNARLVEELAIDLALAEEEATRTGKPARRFRDFRWSTLDSWSRRRRVVGKAEWTRSEANPRFVVTSLRPSEIDAQVLYERIYCARGEMENRIKECQLDLFAGRASAATMRANQLRLWFASMAYVLLCALRRIGLAHTQFANATCGTLRCAENTRELRDKVWRKGLIPLNGMIEKGGVATTSQEGRYELTGHFAALFDPVLVDPPFTAAAEAWGKKYLSKAAIAKAEAAAFATSAAMASRCFTRSPTFMAST